MSNRGGNSLDHYDTVLIVAPHFDDAALSCAAWLDGAAPTERCEVVTVFTGAPDDAVVRSWDANCGFASSAQAMAARRAEDDQAFHDSGVQRHFVGLKEAQYLDGPRGTAEEQLLQAWVRRWQAHTPGRTAVAIPAGAGIVVVEPPVPSAASTLGKTLRRVVGRPGKMLFRKLRNAGRRLQAQGQPIANNDHIWVRDVVAPVVAPQSDLWVYEDAPYLWGKPGDAGATHAARLADCTMVEHVFTVDRNAKAARCAHYKSQVLHMHSPLGGLDTAAGHREVERYWVLSAK